MDEQFEKVRALGRGAQGSVILVRRKADSSLFVIKQIFMEEHKKEDRQQIMNEIKILATLAHPNIVAYYGSFMSGEDLNVVMEYADSGTLFNRIANAKKPLETEEIMPIFIQLAQCLDHLHSKHVLHRDLKTKNIFLTQDDSVKLGDFGLSKILGSQHDMAHSAVGTPYYLSPELCEGRPYDYKSDVWALGCVTYEMTTLRHAFHATNLPALVMTIVQAQYKPVPEHFPEGLRNLIHRCLCKHPADRPSIRQILADPYVVKYMATMRMRSQHQGGMEHAGESAVFSSKPFFAAGTVETDVDKSLREAEQGDHQAASAVSTDAVMREVQEEHNFLRLLHRMRGELQISDRVYDRVPHFQCFEGKALVNFICRDLGIRTRPEAIAAAQRWMDVGVFFHVSKSAEVFRDDGTPYRFARDEVHSILNMRTRCTGSVRATVEVERDVRDSLHRIVRRAVPEGSCLVDYAALLNSDVFDEYVHFSAELQRMDLQSVSFNVKIALFINLYNLLVLHGFLVLGPPASRQQRLHFFNNTAYNVADMTYSLNAIEHGVLRGNQKPPGSYCREFRPKDRRLQAAVVVWDPRIHFALVRGTSSCPRLQVYDPDRLEDMLEASTTEFCSRHVEVQWLGDRPTPDFTTWSVAELKSHLEKEGIDFSKMREKSELRDACKGTLPFAPNGQLARREVALPAIFQLYHDDFGSSDADVLYWLRAYVPAEIRADLDRALQKEDWVLRYHPLDVTSTNAAKPTPPAAGGLKSALPPGIGLPASPAGSLAGVVPPSPPTSRANRPTRRTSTHPAR